MSRYELFCGDCLEMLPTLETGSVQAIIVDPPYGIDYQSNRRVATKKLAKIANDRIPLLGWGEQSFRVTSGTGCILLFYRWDVQQPFIDELSGAGWIVKSQIIWDKLVHGTGDLTGEFAPQHEAILFARKEGFSFPGKRPKSVIRCQKVPSSQMSHPNEKPTALLEQLILAVTSLGDTVLDFTMGCGSCGVAAMRTGRDFVGIEIDRGWFDIAQMRIRNAAGEFERTAKEKLAGQLSIFGDSDG